MIVRQHPGETIGSWMLKIYSAFSLPDPKMRNKLINKFTFHILWLILTVYPWDIGIPNHTDIIVTDNGI